MQVSKIKFSEADKALLQARVKQLNNIGLAQAVRNENFIPTQDASLKIQQWLLMDSITNKKEVHNENY